ncbi:hypothetical protein ILUMI_21989 [Ignelater luminosus]|uniref:Transposase Tc1-like domain-containing protein n=1 Tax=Ignelater luminosus TaxID=2038154 RepID=A0A8K0CFA3_IGNLU|nr:hypothetical protein ILUMI_21989 [Ignelater luminosus]
MNCPRNLREDKAVKVLNVSVNLEVTVEPQDTRSCSTSLELSRALTAARNITISARTVRKRLNEGELDSRRPAIATLLTREHRVTRLRFAREHVNWAIDDWKQVLFSDETRVNLKSPDRRQQVWRRRHISAPMNLRELEQVVLAEWENIPQETIHNLIDSMPTRMEAVIRVRGGSTRY